MAKTEYLTSISVPTGLFTDVDGGPTARQQAETATWVINWFNQACPPDALTTERYVWLHGHFGFAGLGSESSTREWWSKWCKYADTRTWMVEAMVEWSTHVTPSLNGPWSAVEELVGLVLADPKGFEAPGSGGTNQVTGELAIAA